MIYDNKFLGYYTYVVSLYSERKRAQGGDCARSDWTCRVHNSMVDAIGLAHAC